MGPKNKYWTIITYYVPEDLKAAKLVEAVTVQNIEITMDKFQTDFQILLKKSSHTEFSPHD